MGLVLRLTGAALGLSGLWLTHALPNYALRSRQSEVRANLGGLRRSLEEFAAGEGFYPTLDVQPSLVSRGPRSERKPWRTIPCAEECGPRDPFACRSFSCLSWSPQSDTRFWYACTAAARDGVWNFTCAAVGDLDDDGVPSIFVYGSGHGGSKTIVAPVPSIGAGGACFAGVTPADEIVDCTRGAW